MFYTYSHIIKNQIYRILCNKRLLLEIEKYELMPQSKKYSRDLHIASGTFGTNVVRSLIDRFNI